MLSRLNPSILIAYALKSIFFLRFTMIYLLLSLLFHTETTILSEDYLLIGLGERVQHCPHVPETQLHWPPCKTLQAYSGLLLRL